MADTIDFFFDVISPYVYIADALLAGLRERHPGVTIVHRPILFAAVLKHWGQLGPAEIPAKRVFTFKDILRRAAEHGLPLRGVASHPFNPLTAQRAILAAAPEQRAAATTAILRAGWAEGGELGDPAVIVAALDRAGLPGAELVARAGDPAIKAALAAECEHAIRLGVFGVPSWLVRGELIWGQDRLRDVEAVLEGRDPVGPEAIDRLLTRPASAQRRGLGG
ncbi:2-hydroxychromene-2-carboxylate isomerase [Nannocystis sp. SCPEA4]|uniref:2-hydroxychromene-2-carboxylate isomerase n=1 Tax=Nannocystis sp. SCPEA4 TaxID=2996787 RepID=UPI002271EB5F|nr:2-hydroxychromene-2-carboxylate isomerase [Nannocystis sp. SCPEA4]MCY1054504.1 2-hydroxychromene-2-carboxylate isomerase [Nannocystis sp. SCPEA4]